MNISKITIKGYRNYKDATINLNQKSLVIGSNDVGKTNLFHAMRLLLDKSMSEFDLEPKDSDFYAYEDTNEFEIIIQFTDVTEECVVSKLKGKIGDEKELFLVYKGYRDEKTRAKSYKLYSGSKPELLEEIDQRNYIKVLNLRYISSQRDFHKYINKEKSYLFQTAKQNRTEEQVTADEAMQKEIEVSLQKVDEYIPKLTFIASATNSINTELEKLSAHHKNQKIVFDGSASNIDSFISGVSIASKNNGKSLLIGGDGKLNQIYLSLWAARNEITEENLQEVSIICIEEPEAHLHPHQQRKLAEYLSSTINAQVIITTHSPQIACEFSPNSIVRLFNDGGGTRAASEGCSDIIEEAFLDFGYRLSIIPAEAFFADVVLLVEGASEELFYKTLANQIGIDLDRLNISILMVDGVGFATFIDILDSLEIEWVLRTDNDVFKIPKKDAYRLAGVQRIVGFYRHSYNVEERIETILKENEPHIKSFPKIAPPENVKKAGEAIRESMEEFNLFLSNVDLETDLFNSPLKQDLIDFYPELDEEDIIPEMQKRKATFMFDFLRQKKEALKKLSEDGISIPLLTCKQIIDTLQDETD